MSNLTNDEIMETMDTENEVTVLEMGPEDEGGNGLIKAGIAIVGTAALSAGGYLLAKKAGLAEKVAERRDERQMKRLVKRGKIVIENSEETVETAEDVNVKDDENK